VNPPFTTKAKAEQRPPAGQAEAFGSFPGGPGNAGQGKALPVRESGFEKSSGAGAQSSISTNETEPETPNQVRTNGAQSVLAIIGELRGRASRLKADAPMPDIQEHRPKESERLAKEFAEGGRLLMAAVDAGAFAGDDLMAELVGRYRSELSRLERQGWGDALAHSRMTFFKLFDQEWLPNRRPDLEKELSGGGYSVHVYERYAKVMDFIADLVEADYEAKLLARMAAQDATPATAQDKAALLAETQATRQDSPGQSSSPGELANECRCVPMSLAELCRRFMDDQDTRSDKVKALLITHGLRRQAKGKNKWSVRVEGMDPATRERMMRKIYP
jgi:hypothetical protein